MKASPALSAEEIRARVDALGEWFHNLDLNGVKTAPKHFLGDYPNFKFQKFAHALPKDLRGMTVLDIGCNAGFYSIEMKRRGADRVVGIDSDDRYLAQAKFAVEVSGYADDIELQNLSVFEIAALKEKFDLVIFMGVLYHLRHPLLALDLIHEHVARDLLLFQSMQRGTHDVERVAPDYPFEESAIFEKPGYPRMAFVEKKFAHDPTNWWIPNRACVEAMLRSSGFDITHQPEEEVYVCRRRELSEEERGDRTVYPLR